MDDRVSLRTRLDLVIVHGVASSYLGGIVAHNNRSHFTAPARPGCTPSSNGMPAASVSKYKHCWVTASRSSSLTSQLLPDTEVLPTQTQFVFFNRSVTALTSDNVNCPGLVAFFGISLTQ